MRLVGLRWSALVLLCLPVACVDDPVDVDGTEGDSETQMGTTSSSTTMPPPGTSTSGTSPLPEDSSSTTEIGGSEGSSEGSSSEGTTQVTGEDTTSSTTGEPPTSGTTEDVTVADVDTGSTFGDSTFGDSTFGDTGIAFIFDPDVGNGFECDVYLQDCPDGEKCNPWANDGGSSWNAWRCVPLDDDPGQVGDECTVEGSGVSGVDTCDIGLMCFYVDPETNAGTCIELCSGSEDDPTCNTGDSSCIIANDGWLPLCLGNCDPIGQDCPDGQACYGIAGAFVCASDASGDAGAYGDPCEYINACDAGLQCVAAEFVPGCASSGCCSPNCEVSSPDCPDMLDCIAWFDDGEAPEGYEDVGFCGDAP